ncbi:MAG TPA: B12-binding domain-containing protein [Nocardioidaceae bacterium]|nr:B12-binding domain-containing protein [Nocardioidaceae bacterium]
MSDIYQDYFAALTGADVDSAAQLMEDALARGESPRWLITDVVARAQGQVGRLWQEGRWDIADEHAATSVAEQALQLLTRTGPRPPSARRIVLACAEGEWHTMPARLAGELARHSDLDVVMLGGSLPASQLRRYLGGTRPTALALSVTLPTNLIAASRSIEAAHAEGVPVVVGGAAWGEGQLRARRLGADLRLEDPWGLRTVLDSLVAGRWSSEWRGIPAEALLLDAAPRELLQLAFDRHQAASRWVSTLSSIHRSELLTDYSWLARHCAAAVAVRDRTVLRSHLGWLLTVVTQRGLPVDGIADACSYLADTVFRAAPMAAEVLRAEGGAFRANLAEAEARSWR